MPTTRSGLPAMTTTLAAAAALTLAALAVPGPTVAAPVVAADAGHNPSVAAGDDTATPARVTDVDATVPAERPVVAARGYLAANAGTYAIDTADLVVVDVTGSGDSETVRFAQRHRGVPVFGAHYLVHLRPDGAGTEVLGANGSYYTGLAVDVEATATQRQAVEQARRHVATTLSPGSFGASVELPETTARPRGRVVLPNGEGRLAYRVEVSATDPASGAPVVKDVFVDADSGWPLFAYDAISFAGPVEGTGVTYAGDEVPLRLTQLDDGSYAMIDATRGDGPEIRTYDGRGYDALELAGGMPADLPIYRGQSSRFDGPATESGAVDAHVNAAHVLDYYASLGRSGLDGDGGDVTSVVGVTYFGQPYVNAFWDGQKMVYGSGDAEYRAMSADLDVVGHEMTHGVIEHSAGLIYAHQSGAMNEAIADYFGNAIDVDVTGTSMGDPDAGLLGEDLCRTVAPRDCALRDLNDARTVRDYEGLTYSYDDGGVHANSTIFSGALWDLRERLGAARADRLVYKAVTEYLTPTDDFVDGRDAVLQAASDMGMRQRGLVRAAFAQHGIVDGWEDRTGDATQLLTDVTALGTGPSAAGGWWVAPNGSPAGDQPYALYSGRTDGRGGPIKLADPIGDRFNVLPATDGESAVWFAWGAHNAWLMYAPVDGSAEPVRIATVGSNPTRLGIDGDWVTWTANSGRFGSKQMYMNVNQPDSYQAVDYTYHMTSGFGRVKDGKLFYLLRWPDSRYHLNIVVRDLATGAETRLPEIMATETAYADLYQPRLTDGHLVIGVQQQPDDPAAGIWRMNHDGSGRTVLVDESAPHAPLLGDYDATDTAVTYEHWPGPTVPKVWQVGIDGGAVQRMSCGTGLQHRVDADTGRRVVWLDGGYGTTALVSRRAPRSRC